MKKPTISLAAVERVDAVPLRKALELYRKATAEISSARTRETALRKEISGYLESIDVDDEKAVSLVGGKKIQLEILPNLIRKVERTLADQIAPSLLREADKFKSGLCHFYREAHAAVAAQLAEVFRAYFADRVAAGDKVDRAVEIARQTDDCQAIAARLAEAGQIQLPDQPRSNNPAAWDNGVVGAAEQLLVLAEKS